MVFKFVEHYFQLKDPPLQGPISFLDLNQIQ